MHLQQKEYFCLFQIKMNIFTRIIIYNLFGMINSFGQGHKNKIELQLFYQQDSLFDCLQDLESKKINSKLDKQNQQFDSQNKLYNELSNVYLLKGDCQTFKNINQAQTQNQSISSQINEPLKREFQFQQQNQIFYGEDFQEDKKKSTNQSSKQEKQQNNDQYRKKRDNLSDQFHHQTKRQKNYSKNYRQRKKQYYKQLEQQNFYLKKKIDDLQFRLRQKQLEINRLKFVPEQEQMSVQTLNELFLNQVKIVMEVNKQDPEKYKNQYRPEDDFYRLFVKTYSQHGFGGSRKIQLVNYYFNQIIQALLRDSQRYFCLICSKAKDGQSIEGISQYQQINNKFFQILQPNQEKLQRLKYFKIHLHPMILDLVQKIKDFYKAFDLIIKNIDKIHVFMKNTYTTNMDFARKRIIQLQRWFQQHKYDKMMRNLRAQWLQFLKSQIHMKQQKKAQPHKKKKIIS